MTVLDFVIAFLFGMAGILYIQLIILMIRGPRW